MLRKLEQAAMILIALCCVVITVVVLQRQVGGARGAPIARPTTVRDWKSYAVGTQWIGSQDAQVTVTEFSDFQCPYCKRLSSSLESIRAKYPTTVTVAFRNFPLTGIHPFARPAAIAAQCAAWQGAFTAYHDYLYHHQDSLSNLNWTRVAQIAGVGDTGTFRRCLSSDSVLATLKADSAAGVKLGVTGTPTVLVEDLRLPGTPTEALLDSIITLRLRARK